jgi:elongation factor G
LEAIVKEVSIDKIRNVGLISHGGVGKTSLAEGLAFTTGVTNRLGKIEEGQTVSDFHPDEIDRRQSITTSLMHFDWQGNKINLLDTPGYSDFLGEVKGTLRVVETAIVLINAVSGIEVGTEQVWESAKEAGVAKMFFVNRLNKEHANFDTVLESLQKSYGNQVVTVHIPVKPGEHFKSFIDLINMKLVTYEKGGSGKKTESDIPGDLQDQANELREKLVEAAAESDDDILEKYFDAGELTDDEFKKGLIAGLKKGNIYPVLCGVATDNIGSHELLDFIINYTPSPDMYNEIEGEDEKTRKASVSEPMSALVFKTESEPHVGEFSFFRVYSGSVKTSDDVLNPNRDASEKIGQIFAVNGKQRVDMSEVKAGDIGGVVKLKNTHTNDTLCDKKSPIQLKPIMFPDPVIRSAIEPKTRGDEEKISAGLTSLHEEDPTFVFGYDPELRQTIIQGQGEMHLSIVVKRLKDKFNAEIELIEPRIPYRETIKGKSEVQGKYKKQSGGRGQFGDVWLKLEPKARSEGYEFVNAIVGGVVPTKYIPAVDKGIQEAIADGVIAGYPVVDVQAKLFYGSYHSVDSSDMAFKIAGSMAFKKAFMEAKPILLEPIYDVEVRVPEEYLGDVMGDLSSRRGKIMGIDTEGNFQVIKSKTPLGEMYKYSTSLRSITQGRGGYRRKFSHYEEVPGENAEKIIEKAKKDKEEEK